jgi:hypothetical protein
MLWVSFGDLDRRRGRFVHFGRFVTTGRSLFSPDDRDILCTYLRLLDAELVCGG